MGRLHAGLLRCSAMGVRSLHFRGEGGLQPRPDRLVLRNSSSSAQVRRAVGSIKAQIRM